jgi:exodeoxyribonuclease-5
MKGFTDPLPQKGDKLVCLRNNHNEGLLNGQTWTVTHARHKAFLTLHLENEDGDKITCLAHPDHFLDQDDALDPGARKRANEFDFGYAMTVHKAQGSQWDRVVLVNEWAASNRQQWLYTGITRAAKSITILQ